MDVMLHRQNDLITQGIHPLMMRLPIHNQINAECQERTHADTGAGAEHHSWISFGGPLLDKGHAISIALHPLPHQQRAQCHPPQHGKHPVRGPRQQLIEKGSSLLGSHDAQTPQIKWVHHCNGTALLVTIMAIDS